MVHNTRMLLKASVVVLEIDADSAGWTLDRDLSIAARLHGHQGIVSRDQVDRLSFSLAYSRKSKRAKSPCEAAETALAVESRGIEGSTGCAYSGYEIGLSGSNRVERALSCWQINEIEIDRCAWTWIVYPCVLESASN